MSNDGIRLEWRFWFPDRGESEEDSRPWEDLYPRSPERVAGDIAEKTWHAGSPDYFTELRVELRDPDGKRHTCDAFVECEPSFRVGRVR